MSEPARSTEVELTVADPDRRLVLVLGPGRSGTSTMAGALALSGYAVPQAIAADETNPAGFFEPRWVVDLHTELLSRVGVRTLDTDPEALARVSRVNDDERVRARLRTWLAEQLEHDERLVIKDPRLVWFRDLWVRVAADLGAGDPAYVVMLRHPSEVSSSRSEYYNVREVTGVAGWINVALMTERLTAGSPRAFVRYPSLTSDWRAELTRLREALGLHLDPPPDLSPHPVDDFIDPSLRRMKPGWEHVSVPGFLQDLGDRTFDALGALADGAGDEEVAPTLAAIRTDYAQLHQDALALVDPRVKRARHAAQRQAARRARARTQAQPDAAQRQETVATGLGGRVARRLWRVVR